MMKFKIFNKLVILARPILSGGKVFLPVYEKHEIEMENYDEYSSIITFIGDKLTQKRHIGYTPQGYAVVETEWIKKICFEIEATEQELKNCSFAGAHDFLRYADWVRDNWKYMSIYDE